jgi:hypothetical protein
MVPGNYSRGFTTETWPKTGVTVVNEIIVDSNGQELKKTWKYYQLKKIESSETFTVEQVERERPMTNIQRRNKRELDELERIREPETKRRKIFQGTYFLGNGK